MSHYTEDELVLFFYGEGRRRGAVQQHLDACDTCSALYREIADTMRMVATPEAPARDERYGLEVWQRIRPVLPVAPPSRAPFAWFSRTLAVQLSLAALIVIAFVAGREWPRSASNVQSQPSAVARSGGPGGPESNDAMLAGLTDADRIRIAAISDHLEETERLLLDFVNAGGPVVDVSSEQALAADLVEANRLYRDAAVTAGDDAVADVLDALERNLMEIAHGPSTLAPADFTKLRMRLDAAALLFKVRVLSDELHVRQQSAPKASANDA